MNKYLLWKIFEKLKKNKNQLNFYTVFFSESSTVPMKKGRETKTTIIFIIAKNCSKEYNWLSQLKQIILAFPVNNFAYLRWPKFLGIKKEQKKVKEKQKHIKLPDRKCGIKSKPEKGNIKIFLLR